MIACDTNVLVAYLRGDRGPEMDRVDATLEAGRLFIPPVVLAELLSDPAPSRTLSAFLADIVPLEATDGYWRRAGENRAILFRLGFKPKLADALIAQSCIDHQAALLTRDAGFKRFAKHCGLKLA